jgi:hypothetical protein
MKGQEETRGIAATYKGRDYLGACLANAMRVIAYSSPRIIKS